jgi:hypothetical protein
MADMNKLFEADNLMNIILFSAGYVIAAIQSYWQSRRGRWIIVEKVAETLVFSKPAMMNGDKSIEIRVQEKSIQSLVQTQLQIINTGADIKESLTVKLIFNKLDSDDTVIPFGIKAKPEFFVWYPPDTLILQRPFFNSSRAYKDVLNVFIYSEHSLTIHVDGNGVAGITKTV